MSNDKTPSQEAAELRNRVFDGRPVGLKLAAGKLTGDIAKGEVHVYRFATH